MPDYQYTAREVSGRQVNGVLTAASEKEVLANLAAQQLFPINVSITESSKASDRNRTRRVPARVLSVFYSQLADLLTAGVPLLRSLELLGRQSLHPALKAVIGDIRDQVANGSRLYDAMRQHPKAFNELMISMVRAGEEGGFLEDVLKRISMFTEHQEELKGRVIGAMIYPIFLLGVGGLAVSAAMVWFVPQFQPIFDTMAQRGQLPQATSILMGLSEYAKNYWMFIVIGLAAIIYGFNTWLKTESGRYHFDYFQLNAYGLGRIVKSLSVARFCRVLGTLLANGVPVLNSLRIAKDATGNKVLTEAIDKAADNVSTGKSLAGPLGASGQFPEEIVEMISVGEEANNLENVLIGISENLEKRVGRELEMLVRLLEPVLLMIMGAIVLFIVIAILLPILKSSGAV